MTYLEPHVVQTCGVAFALCLKRPLLGPLPFSPSKKRTERMFS